MNQIGDELQKLWSVVEDHQLIFPGLCVAALALLVWVLHRAVRRGPGQRSR